LQAKAHKAGARASAAVDIQTGTVDAYLAYDYAGTTTKLNSASAAYNGIQLSADGTKVVFTADDSAGYSQVFVASVNDFDNPTQLTSSETEDHYNAKLSPDGTMIISSEQYVGPWYSGVVWYYLSMISTASGAETLIIPPPTIVFPASPILTPDGTKLIVSGQSNSGEFAIYSVNVDGTGLTQLSYPNERQNDFAPSLSPDGSIIAFTRGTISTTDVNLGNYIYVMGIGGESSANPATQLTTDGESWQPVYLADSIVFESFRDNVTTTGNDQIYRMGTDGSNVVRLTNDSYEDGFDLNYDTY